jgi:PAS domain S-box-containing protein
LLWLHAAGIAGVALNHGPAAVHGLLAAGLLALAAAAAGIDRASRRVRSVLASLGLLTASAELIDLSGGYIELHFHIFVMLAVIALYQDWLPYLLALGYVVVHHGLVGTLAPAAVFNHPAAWAEPWRWAALHGVFVLAFSVASIAGWRLGERAQARAHLTLRAAGDGICGLDRQGRITFTNPAAARLLGWQADDLLGRPFAAVTQASPATGRLPEPPAAPATTAGPERAVATFRRQDGAGFPVVVTRMPVWERGRLTGSVVTFQDVTEQQGLIDELRALEARYRQLVEQANDFIIIFGPDGRFQFVNQRFCAVMGYSADEAARLRVSAVIHPDDRARMEDLIRRRLRGEPAPVEGEVRVVTRDGRTLSVHYSTTTLWRDGRVAGIQTIARDITERRRAEVMLRARARQQAAVASLGRQALAGGDLDALLDATATLVAQTLEVEYSEVLELRPGRDDLWLRAGAGWRTGLVSAATAGVEHASPAGYTLLTGGPVIVEDLDAETRFSAPSLLRDHAVASGISVVIGGPEQPFGVLGAHTRQRRAFSAADVDFLTAVAHILATAIDRARSEAGLRFLAEAGELLAGSLAASATLAALGRLAVPFLADYCLIDLVTEDGTLDEVVVMHADPAKAQVIRDQRRRQPVDLAGAHTVAQVLRTGQPLLVPRVTEAVLRGFGLTDEHRRLIHALGFVSSMAVPLVARGRTLGVIQFIAAESGRRYGATDLRLAGELAERAALAVDNARLYDAAQQALAALRRSEAQLVQSAKLAAVGTLAASVAHELNQPLMIVRNQAQALRARADAPNGWADKLARIERQTDKMLTLVSHLRTFGRVSGSEVARPIDLNAVAGEALLLIGAQLRERGITLTLALAEAAPVVLADASQVEQIVLNLLVNARDALGQAGEIVVRTWQDTAGGHLSVADSGPGLPPEVEARLFEPFFTTKPAGAGTGLGLSISRDIARKWGGELTLANRPDAPGAIARLTLVAASTGPEPAA